MGRYPLGMRLLLLTLCGCTWITDAELRDLQDRDGDSFLAVAAGGLDCDDRDDRVNPDAEELCNGVDDDCDGGVDLDASDAVAWFNDRDGDGFGEPDSVTLACVGGSDQVEVGGDCDDRDDSIHPGAAEVCGDGVDQDCDGLDPECPELGRRRRHRASCRWLNCPSADELKPQTTSRAS